MSSFANKTPCLHFQLNSSSSRAFNCLPRSKRTTASCRRRLCHTSSLYGNGSSDAGSSRLIMPGTQSTGNQRQQQPNRPESSSGLILPSKGSGGKPQLGNTPVNNFRPPPGFMDSADAKQPVTEDPQKLLAKLKTGTGHWHELARALPALQRAGFDWLAIEAETGLERALQSIWTIAGQVYDSLKQQANFPQEKLKYFNPEDSEYKLYPMRILAVTARGPVAEYIVDHDLNTTVCCLSPGWYKHCVPCFIAFLLVTHAPANYQHYWNACQMYTPEPVVVFHALLSIQILCTE